MHHIASSCNYLQTVSLLYTIWEQPDYYNQDKVISINMEKMDFLSSSAHNLVFERETCMAYTSQLDIFVYTWDNTNVMCLIQRCDGL